MSLPKRPDWAIIQVDYMNKDDKSVKTITFSDGMNNIVARYSTVSKDFEYVNQTIHMRQMKDIVKFIIDYNDENIKYNFLRDSEIKRPQSFTVNQLLNEWGLEGQYRKEAKRAIVFMIDNLMLEKQA